MEESKDTLAVDRIALLDGLGAFPWVLDWSPQLELPSGSVDGGGIEGSYVEGSNWERLGMRHRY
jgi:hypothetical protein